MNRRTFLATSFAGIAFGVGGCLGNSSSDNLDIVGIYGNDIDRDFLDGEYLLLENSGENSLDISGYVVEYPSGYTHEIENLVLEPGARLALMSREGDDSVLETSPPLYLRFLGAEPSSLLGESGTVRVRDANRNRVAEVTYEDFGDGGT